MAWIDKGYKWLSGTISGSTAGPHTARIRVREEIDISANKSRLTFTIWAAATSSSSYTGRFYFGGASNAIQLKVGDTTIATFAALSSPSHSVTFSRNDGTEYQVTGSSSSWTIEIPHDNDGKKSVSVTLSGRFFRESNIYFNASWNATLVLEDIPRGSFVSVDDGSNTKYRLFIDDGQMTPYFAYIDTGSWERY